MFRKTKQTKAYKDIIDQVERAIMDGALKPGDKLPNERELQEIFHTGRNTLREAYRVLEQKGLIEIRLGSKGGAFVTSPSRRQMSESLDLLIRYQRVALEDLNLFREILEVPAAERAAELAQKEDLEHLADLLAEAKEHLEEGVSRWEEFYETETLMHRSLARMTRNPLLESVLLTIYDNNMFYIDFLPRSKDNMQEAYEDWGQILKWLDKGEPKKVKEVIKRHVRSFNNYTQDGQTRKGQTRLKHQPDGLGLPGW
ncbi:MAG: FadR family transcriptional regulator [Deltaproteobacteria bacterium]|nr:FadR family transcriptional regulator [Deltaproteobacteria bacterium]